jgi:hypothetical protein
MARRHCNVHRVKPCGDQSRDVCVTEPMPGRWRRMMPSGDRPYFARLGGEHLRVRTTRPVRPSGIPPRRRVVEAYHLDDVAHEARSDQGRPQDVEPRVAPGHEAPSLVDDEIIVLERARIGGSSRSIVWPI